MNIQHYDVDGNILETDIPNTVSTGFLFHRLEGNKRGLSIETVLPNVGDTMLFDACQIHASCVKHNNKLQMVKVWYKPNSTRSLMSDFKYNYEARMIESKRIDDTIYNPKAQY